MIKSTYNVIGVMSGTSLDGIDLAYITFTFDGKWHFKINHVDTIAYTEDWLFKLKHLVQHTKNELSTLDSNYTLYLAHVITHFIRTHSLKNVDAVCSHGHTALHKPEDKLTYQIGNLPILAQLLNQTVICDFRVQDVALGGQGAPLVPIGDAQLFQDYNYCVNLGGFANVSTEVKGKRIAFDICPVNIVLNTYVSAFGVAFDDKGAFAKEGTISNPLLNALNNLQYYKKSYPKSLGLEWVNTVVFPLIETFTLSVKDVLRTLVEHIAIQISTVINSAKNASVLITGGGVYNTFLMSRLTALSTNKIIVPSQEIIEFKEALIFGFLGVLKLRGENNCLSSVTGALKDHCSGEIYIS